MATTAVAGELPERCHSGEAAAVGGALLLLTGLTSGWIAFLAAWSVQNEPNGAGELDRVAVWSLAAGLVLAFGATARFAGGGRWLVSGLAAGALLASGLIEGSPLHDFAGWSVTFTWMCWLSLGPGTRDVLITRAGVAAAFSAATIAPLLSGVPDSAKGFTAVLALVFSLPLMAVLDYVAWPRHATVTD